MAVVACGALLGRLQVRGVRLDVAAMLLVGALAAHFGVLLPPELGLFGLLLFLYTVGVQAGPALRNFHRGAVRLAAVAVGCVVALFGASVAAGALGGIPTPVTLGAFAGFFSSGAALAIFETRWGTGTAAAGFALATPVCSLLVILVAQVWRARLRGRVQPELDAWNRDLKSRSPRSVRAGVVVTNPEVDGATLRQLRLPCTVLSVERAGENVTPRAHTRLDLGALVQVKGEAGKVEAAVARLGTRAPIGSHKEAHAPVSRRFFVSEPAVIGRRIEDLLLRERHGATVSRVRRAGVELSARPGFRFRWGDRVDVRCAPDRADALRRFFGDDTAAIERTAFPRAAVILFLGGLLGLVPLHVGEGRILQLGPALGVLALSALAAALHRTGPLLWSQSDRTLRLFSQIGLPLFLAQVGNASYDGLCAGWRTQGATLAAIAVVPALLVVPVVLLAGRLLGAGPLRTLSLLPCVALNTPAYDMIQDDYRERLPAHVYATAYPAVSLALLLLSLVASAILA